MADMKNSVGDLVALEFASKLFYIPFKTEDNPNGTFNERELLKIFQNANIYIFFDHDPTKTWARRRRGKEGIAALGKKLIPIIEDLAGGGLLKGLKDNLTAGAKSPMTEYGKTFAKTLLSQGKKPKEVAWTLICLAVAFIANTAQAVSTTLSGYLLCFADDLNAPVRPNHRLLPQRRERRAFRGDQEARCQG